MSTKDVIAANLRTLRKVRGWSQPELAAKVGISPRTVARLEAAQVADPSIKCWTHGLFEDQDPICDRR